MNLYQISNTTVGSVAEVFKIYRDAAWGKTEAILSVLQTWGEEERWLFSFANYFVSVNRVWSSIDETLYYTVPVAQVAEVSFMDFIRLIRHYHVRKYSPDTEKELILFLRKCTAELREFYLPLLSRPQWLLLLFRNKELQEYSDMTAITAGDIYSPPSLLRDGFYSISFPFTVTALPECSLRPAVICCYSGVVKIFVHTITNSSTRAYAREAFPSAWLKRDLPFLRASTFALYGLMDEDGGRFYPLDMFSNYREYLAYKRKKEVTPYEQRFANLTRLLDTTFLIQIHKIPRTLCHHPSEVVTACEGTLTDATPTLLLADRFHREHFVRSVKREGVIGDFWVEKGEVKGLIVWHCAIPYTCPHVFSGVSASLLLNPTALKGTHVTFRIMEFDSFTFGSISEILWDKKPYRKLPYTFENGSVGYIERCPYCLRQDVTQHHDGICGNSWRGWRSLLETWGDNRWFKVSPKIIKRRELYGWHPDSINQVMATYRGYRIKANKDGEVMFATDAAAQQRYQKYLNGVKNEPDIGH